MSKRFLNFLLFFLSFTLLFQLFLAPDKAPTPVGDAPLTFETSKDSYATGKVVALNIYNHTAKNILIENTCPTEPLTVVKVLNGEYTKKESTPYIDCRESLDPATKNILLKAGRSTQVKYSLWSNSLFSELGRYKIIATFDIDGKKSTIESNEFEIKERGFWGKVWLNGLYQPTYNFLVYLISISPNLNLGIAIILLTIIVRLILYVPNQRALVAQKKLAEVQPKLNALREKYKDNQEMLAAETMKIWKENKVNPLGGCLPLLIQFPVLIVLFYVIQDGLNPDKVYLLYEPLKNFDFSSIDLNFLWLHLTTKDLIALPLIVGGLQFAQLKIANLGKDKNASISAELQMTQNMMLYVMPAMIAVFTASLPAGVGIYWGTSTVVGIIQQIIVNKSNTKKSKKTDSDVRVKKVEGETNKERKKNRYKK
jgi:YidC/Oxa1 family membrane protein insertase